MHQTLSANRSGGMLDVCDWTTCSSSVRLLVILYQIALCTGMESYLVSVNIAYERLPEFSYFLEGASLRI